MNHLTKILILFLLCLSCFACTDETSSKDALRKAGFTDVEITGYSWYSCGENDFYSTGFKATNVNGERVEGTVCCGLIAKDCTIRF